MKLTKGKISKLYNKKRQSLKKKNNKRKTSSKNMTFRKKRNIHLARKSLKNFHYKKQSGGEDGYENLSQETMPKAEGEEDSNSVRENMNQPLLEDSSPEDSSPAVIQEEIKTPIEETVTQLDTPNEETIIQREAPSDKPSEDNTQNGFDSINAAVETMAISGGKKRKTRKFKLTNKNKTKHQ
jgi:hypothetical protein